MDPKEYAKEQSEAVNFLRSIADAIESGSLEIDKQNGGVVIKAGEVENEIEEPSEVDEGDESKMPDFTAVLSKARQIKGA